jgi:hypothetical protein
MRKPATLVLSLLLSCAGSFAVFALDAERAPGGNFDLTHWKLTLPDATASEILPEQLAAGYTNASWFYTGPDGAMIFWCPVTGGHTSNSSYPRSELREMLHPTNNMVNWTATGTHTLDARCQVLQVPSSSKVIIGQIHGYAPNSNPLIKLQFNGGKIEALVKADGANDTKLSFMTVPLSNNITYRIQVTDGLLTLSVNGSNRAINVFQANPAWRSNIFYFKAGSYCQDNSGTNTQGSLVKFDQLTASHSGPTLNSALDTVGRFRGTLFGVSQTNYVVEASTNLTAWSPILTNSSTNGIFSFNDPDPSGPNRFYRARTP